MAAEDDQTEEVRRLPPSAGEETPLVEKGKDDKADLEFEQLKRGLPVDQLEEEARRAEHRRQQRFKDHFELMALITVWCLFVGFILFGFAWMWHMMTPDTWHFLTQSQLDKIQGLLTGGVIAGLVADHVRRRMG